MAESDAKKVMKSLKRDRGVWVTVTGDVYTDEEKRIADALRERGFLVQAHLGPDKQKISVEAFLRYWRWRHDLSYMESDELDAQEKTDRFIESLA